MIKLKKVVVLGGGTGLSTLLRGLKQFPIDITAIVTVSDDGTVSFGSGRTGPGDRHAASAVCFRRLPSDQRVPCGVRSGWRSGKQSVIHHTGRT